MNLPCTPRSGRHLLSAGASLALLLAAGAASGAQGLYPYENLATPHPSPTPNSGNQAIAFVNSLPLGVSQLQPGSSNTSANVPLCLSNDEKSVGHAYAIKATSGANAGQWVPTCYTAAGPTTGARILRPPVSQSSTIQWVNMQKGQALPRRLAAVAYVGSNRVPVYACKDGVAPNETVGTLQPDGSCRLAKTLTQDSRTVTSSRVLVNSSSGDASPAYGWITVADGFPHPGGSLVQWPNGATYCAAGGLHGVLELETNASNGDVGSVKGCRVPQAIPNMAMGSTILADNIRVFRNDAQSGVAFQHDVIVGGASGRPEVTLGATRACYARNSGGYLIPAAVSTGFLCRTALGDVPAPHMLLRRTGRLPGEGDRA